MKVARIMTRRTKMVYWGWTLMCCAIHEFGKWICSFSFGNELQRKFIINRQMILWNRFWLKQVDKISLCFCIEPFLVEFLRSVFLTQRRSFRTICIWMKEALVWMDKCANMIAKKYRRPFQTSTRYKQQKNVACSKACCKQLLLCCTFHYKCCHRQE